MKELKKEIKLINKLNKLETRTDKVDYFLEHVFDEELIEHISLFSNFIGVFVALMVTPFFLHLGILACAGIIFASIFGVEFLTRLARRILTIINNINFSRYKKIKDKLEKLNSFNKDDSFIKNSTKDQIIKAWTKQAKKEYKQNKAKVKEKEKLVNKLSKLKQAQNKDKRIQLLEEKLEEYQEFNV